MLHIPGAWQRAARGAGLLSPDGTLAATIFAELELAEGETGRRHLLESPSFRRLLEAPPSLAEAA